MARSEIIKYGALAKQRKNEMQENNEFEANFRRMVEKLARIAHGVAEELDWDETLVFKDLLSDLALINNPSLIAKLDPNNPIDQMTSQIMRMYIGNEEDFNVTRNAMVSRLTNMREQDAVNLICRMFNQGQISGGQYQRLENNERHLIGDTLVPPTQECLDAFEELLKENGWKIEKKGKTIFGNLHYQIRSVKNTFDAASFIEEMKNNLEVILNKIEDSYNCPITFSAGLMEDGTITAGLDVREMSVKDSKVNDDFYYGRVPSNAHKIFVGPYSTIKGDFNTYIFLTKEKVYAMVSNSEAPKHYHGTFIYAYPQGSQKEIDKVATDIMVKLEAKLVTIEELEKIEKENEGPKIKQAFEEAERLIASDSKVEDTPNEEAFVAKFGAKNLTRFNRIKQKLEGNMRDITWVTSHIETPEELNEIFNNVEFGNYEPIAENEDYVVYEVKDLATCQSLAKGTNWCIAVPRAWNAYAAFGATYNFYMNKINGEKYCVAIVGDGKEIVDKNDHELASLPEGVPGEQVQSSVVSEDMPIEEATLKAALANVQILPVETLRIAYDDMFGEELDMLDDNEVKEWLMQKLPEIDTNELKTYIEDHINDFAVVSPIEEEIETEITDSSEFTDNFKENLKKYFAKYPEIEIKDTYHEDIKDTLGFDLTLSIDFGNEYTDEPLNSKLNFAFLDFIEYEPDYEEEFDYSKKTLQCSNKEELLEEILEHYNLENLKIMGYKVTDTEPLEFDGFDENNFSIKTEYFPETEDSPEEYGYWYKGTLKIYLELWFEKEND